MTPGEATALEYKVTLSELEQNSKVQINALTMLAEENKEHAFHIATCIEDQLKSVPDKRKLYILYLIDSICKNFPKSIYVQFFTQNIVSNFCNVFEVSDERTRKSLHKLRLTWDETRTFPIRKLTAIDERIHEMDPRWPIIHRSKKQQQPQLQQQQQNQHHHQQQQELLQPQPIVQSQQMLPPQSIIPAQPILQLQPVLQPQPLLPPQTILPVQPILQPQQLLQTQPILTPQPILQPILQPQPTIQPQPLLQPQPIVQPEPLLEAQQQQQQTPTALELLYSGKQCSSCCLRFDDNHKYSIHLDWHYRTNLKSEGIRARRKWFYPLKLWVQFREISDGDELENNDDHEDNNKAPQVDGVSTAPAFKDDAQNVCPVCHECFKKFWAEEEEEWRLQNAELSVDGRVYHPLCLSDMNKVF